MPRRALFGEEAMGFDELGAAFRVIAAPAGALGTDLREMGPQRQGAHFADELLGPCQQRIDGVVVIESDLGARQRHHVVELLDRRATLAHQHDPAPGDLLGTPWRAERDMGLRLARSQPSHSRYTARS